MKMQHLSGFCFLKTSLCLSLDLQGLNCADKCGGSGGVVDMHGGFFGS